jgi:hypothetical protein
MSTDDSSRSRSRSRGVHAQPSDEIGDVAAALLQVRIGELLEHRAHFVKHLLDGPLGVDALLADDVGRARQQHGIVEHQQLGVEQGCKLGPARGEARLDLDQLFTGPHAAVVEPSQLPVEACRRNLIAEHVRALDEHHGAARDDARRDADSFQPLHASSPNPVCTNATSAATASFSSAPSAEIVIVDPRAAASKRIPMMLFPSISRRSRETLTRAS